MGIVNWLLDKRKTRERPLSRGEAKEQFIDLALRTVPPAQELTYCFICSGNPSLIKACHGVFRLGAPAYGGSAAYYCADESALSARQADASTASLLFAGQESMGEQVNEVANVADVLAKLRAGSARGAIFISFATVGPTGQKWMREVYTTLLGEAVGQGILPFRMYTTASKDAAQFLLDSFSAEQPSEGRAAPAVVLACCKCGNTNVRLAYNGSHKLCRKCGAIYCKSCQTTPNGGCPKCREVDRWDFLTEEVAAEVKAKNKPGG